MAARLFCQHPPRSAAWGESADGKNGKLTKPAMSLSQQQRHAALDVGFFDDFG
jgi:hypothetical protein